LLHGHKNLLPPQLSQLENKAILYSKHDLGDEMVALCTGQGYNENRREVERHRLCVRCWIYVMDSTMSTCVLPT